jgi:hypothetical protein
MVPAGKLAAHCWAVPSSEVQSVVLELEPSLVHRPCSSRAWSGLPLLAMSVRPMARPNSERSPAG